MPSFWRFFLWLTVVTISSCRFLCYGSIHDKVSYHELISVHASHVRERRSVNSHSGIEWLSKEFNFQAFNRTFECHLTPRSDFLSPSFKLKVYGADGVPHEHNFRRDQIFVGKCKGDPKSEIRGVFKGGVFSGSVFYEGEHYGIENAKHHVPSDKAEEQMIVYRTSDMKWDEAKKENGRGPAFCGNTHANEDILKSSREKIVLDDVVSDKGDRYRRASTPSWNTCRIVAVADFKFFREIGSSDVYDTALYMAGVMDRVDNIYRNTEFNIGSAVKGLGFEIAEMRIYKAPTSGFNRDTGTWGALALLQAFSANSEYSEFCAAHLFTHQSFEGNVLGLAYIAPPNDNGIGGICSPTAFIVESLSSLNTGWSSTRNQNGETVLMQQSDLVTAHELGHNWGSEHDPDSGSCSPSSTFGDGKYLMYPYSVSGYDPNHYKFSPCSRDWIGSVLRARGSSCLVDKSTDEDLICGNGLLDPGEECDAGFIGRFNLDSCCDSSCRLVGGATCSPVNHACCFNCQVATIGTVCRSDNTYDCFKSAVCDGINLNCPPAEFKDDGEECLDEGECQGGECVPFCESKGLVSCACDVFAESCQRCCHERGNNTVCQPYDNNHPLPDGRPCVGGYCEGAVCQKSTASTIERLFEILENLDIDGIVEFFRNNLVGAVIVFSLLIWIPFCIIISCLDRKTRKRLNRSEEIEIRTDRSLLHDEDGRTVIQASSSPRNGISSPRYRSVNFTDLGGFGSDA